MQLKVYVNLSLFINLFSCLSCMNFLRSCLLSNYNTVSVHPRQFTDVFLVSNSFINFLLIFPQILTNGKQTKVVEFKEKCKRVFYQEFPLWFHKYKSRSRYVTPPGWCSDRERGKQFNTLSELFSHWNFSCVMSQSECHIFYQAYMKSPVNIKVKLLQYVLDFPTIGKFF